MEYITIMNKRISQEDLEKIIGLKEEHWKYGKISQLAWMNTNLRDDDMHVLGIKKYRGGGYCVKSYLNLVNIKATIDGTIYSCFGIGNVCVDKEHERNGFGKEIMNYADDFLLKHNMCGILLCKPKVRGFYIKVGWSEIFPSEVSIRGMPYHDLVMLFNAGAFREVFLNANKILIDRSF